MNLLKMRPETAEGYGNNPKSTIKCCVEFKLLQCTSLKLFKWLGKFLQSSESYSMNTLGKLYLLIRLNLLQTWF